MAGLVALYAAAAAPARATAPVDVRTAQAAPTTLGPSGPTVRWALPGMPTAAEARNELKSLKLYVYKDDKSYQRSVFGG